MDTELIRPPDLEKTEGEFINRITVVEKIYLQVGIQQPSSVVHQYSRKVSGDEDQFYERRYKATNNPQPFDNGWISPQSVGLMVVINSAGKFQTTPTEEEQTEESKKILEIMTDDGIVICKILPGESLKMQPVDLSKLRIRSQYGIVKYRLYLFPE